MEILTAIALMCQLNIGAGGSEYIPNVVTLHDRVFNGQKACQKKLATCLLKDIRGTIQVSKALKCVKDR